jgi:epoxyqueuosine reductase QueG
MTQCPTGKIRYRDRVAAMIALSKIEMRSKRKRGKSRPKHERTAYRCKECAGFHLSSL